MGVRRYLSLIVEHDDPDLVGLVKVYERPKAKLLKNEPSPIQKFDEDTEDFYVAGTEVGLGYHDFESEEQYEAEFAEVAAQKLSEIDGQWREDAGVPEEVVA